ncbi:hypothetical protein [Streptomyces mexicanus]|uniref:hypothetical protein n=1 Tax=Streptomyces mexicanus TaxID=178566 RepID=UPI0036699D18
MTWTARVQQLRATTEQRFPVVTELTDLTCRSASWALLGGGTRLGTRAFLASIPFLFAVAVAVAVAVAPFAPRRAREQPCASVPDGFRGPVIRPRAGAEWSGRSPRW